MSKEKEERSGVVLVFLAAILYSLGGVCIKVIPWSGMSINSGRNLIALVVIGLYLWRVGHRLRFNPWIGLGAAAICGTNTLFTLANKMTTAANAIVLQFTAPIFVLLLTALVFLFILLLYRFATPLDKPRPPVIPGSLVAAVALTAASMVFSYFMENSTKYSLVYGSLTSMIILLVWLYLCGNVLIVGSLINYVIHQRKRRKSV